METQDLVINHFHEMVSFATELKALPAEILEHTYSPQMFGSWWVTLRVRGVAFRVTCDGRERLLIVQRSESRKPPYDWQPLDERPLDTCDIPHQELIDIIRSGGAKQ